MFKRAVIVFFSATLSFKWGVPDSQRYPLSVKTMKVISSVYKLKKILILAKSYIVSAAIIGKLCLKLIITNYMSKF